MKSKFRRRLLAIMLCLAMLLNGNVSLLAEDGVDTVDQEVTVESETLEETTVEEETSIVEAIEEFVEEIFEASEEIVEADDSIDDTIVLTTELNGTTITMSGPKSSFPEGSDYSVSASEINEEALDDVEASLRKVELETNEKIVSYKAYDIKLIVDGNEAQPVGDVNVTFQGGEVKEQVAGAENVEVYHVNEEKQQAEQVEGEVVNNKVEMTTDHFSTYVITTTNTEGVTVTVQHYLTSTNSKIYRDSQEQLTVSQRLEDISVAANYTVDKVVRLSGKNEIEVQGTDLITEAATYRVYYSATEGQTSGSVQMFDYQVRPETGNSFNVASNYPSESSSSTRVSAGKVGQNDSATKYNVYKTINGTRRNVNDYTGGKTVVPGIITGVDYATGALKMGQSDSGLMYEPGFFTTVEKSGKQVLSGYTLLFDRTGDTYTLESVWNGDTKADDAGSNFYPLEAIKGNHPDSANNDNNNNHNHFFGLRYDIEFTIGDYVGPLSYTFSGDDDMWVVLDAKDDPNGGKVVVDLGGIHQENSDTVNLWTALGLDPENTTEAQRNETHTLTVLYMERGAGQSNCTMSFTLPNSKVINSTQNPTSFEFDKVKSNDEALAGASFGLYDSHGTLIDTATSESNGKVSFDNLYDGTYTIKETKAPAGYVKSTTEYTLTVADRVGTMTVAGNLSPVTKVTNYTQQEEAVSNITLNKTASSLDENNRKFTISLSAATRGESEGTASKDASIVLVLDASGSLSSNTFATLKNGAKNFIAQIAEKSPTSEVAVIWYQGGSTSSAGTVDTKGFISLSDDTELTQLYGSMDLKTNSGGTPMDVALEAAYNKINSASDENNKYVVFFTDGLPGWYDPTSYSYGNSERNYNCKVANGAVKYASQIKDANGGNAILYTVGYGLNNTDYINWTLDSSATINHNNHNHNTTTYGNEFLSTYIASNGKAFVANTETAISQIFTDIAGEVGELFAVQADQIVDVIDSRFELTQESHDALKAEYGDNVQITTDNNGVTTITWLGEAALIANEQNGGWSEEIIVQAKPDFVGGNAIPTNGPTSGIIIDGQLKPFPQPSVNVKLLNLYLEGKEITVFKGDVIDTTAFAEALADSFKVVQLYDTAGQKISVFPELTEEQLNTLKTTGVVEIDYSYPGTTDVIGKFKLELSHNAAFETNHVEAVSGNDVEKYTLKVTYIADTVEARMAELSGIEQPTVDGGTVVTTKEIIANYVVDVISGQIQLMKTINKESSTDQTFTFLVKGVDTQFEKLVTITVPAGKTSALYEGNELTDLARGTYKVTELETEGYVLSDLGVYANVTTCESRVANTDTEESVTFVLGNDVNGKDVIKSFKYDEKDGGTVGAAHFTNDEATKDWGIVKRSSSSTANNQIYLEGAEFELRLKNETPGSVWYKGISEADGTITWYKNGTDKLVAGQYIAKGEYILKEVKAPAGYSVSDVEWNVIIAAKGYLKSITADKGAVSMALVDDKEVYFFDNTPVYSLPSAGGIGIFVYMIGGVMLMAFATFVLYKNRRKEVLAR